MNGHYGRRRRTKAMGGSYQKIKQRIIGMLFKWSHQFSLETGKPFSPSGDYAFRDNHAFVRACLRLKNESQGKES